METCHLSKSVMNTVGSRQSLGKFKKNIKNMLLKLNLMIYLKNVLSAFKLVRHEIQISFLVDVFIFTFIKRK